MKMILQEQTTIPPTTTIILHSVCREPPRWDEESSNGDQKSDTVDSYSAWWQELIAFPVSCTILMLPEIPTAELSHKHELFQYPQAILNSCGIPNVLLLQEPIGGLGSSQNILLSLTSCHSLVPAQPGLLLPVEPNPSTFVVSLPKNDAAAHRHHWNILNIRVAGGFVFRTKWV